MTLTNDELQALARDYTAAWNSGSAEAVAAFCSQSGGIVVNRGTPWEGRAGIQAMAEGFFADVPDLDLTCDGIRAAVDHIVYLWTFTGHAAGTGNPLVVRGWEEWDIDADGRITASRGWFDAQDYARQTAGG